MKGSVFKRGDRWYIRYDLELQADGKRRQKVQRVFGTKKDAERELSASLHEVHCGTTVNESGDTVAEYLERWLADYARLKVGAKTYQRYEQIVRGHLCPALGRHRLDKLRAIHIQSYYRVALESGRIDRGGGLSAQTVLHHHRVLREALEQAVKWQLLVRNVANSVQPPRPSRPEMRALDASQIRQLLTEARGKRLYLPVLLAIATGMRRGEILALTWNDIDLTAGVVTVRRALSVTRDGLVFKQPKSGRGRTVTLPKMAVRALSTHRQEQAKQRDLLGKNLRDEDLVIAGPEGEPWHPDTFASSFKWFANHSGLPHFRFHDLRHSHATQLLIQGIHPKVVSERLGHSTISITLDIYSHVMPGMQAEAAQQMDTLLREDPEQEG